MTITKTKKGTELTLEIDGVIDTTTVSQLEKELNDSIGGVTKLTFDFAKLEYISSAGLRILLTAQKTMNRQGEMIVRNCNEVISEIFEVTRFIDILTIK